MKKSIALIFAGGVGTRMRTKEALPKQFLEVSGKPIIIYTLEKFENCSEIDGIVVSIVKGWRDYLEKMIQKFQITKVLRIVEGGTNTQMSQYNALEAIKEYADQNTVVLIHDGVRPLVETKTIRKSIDSVRKYGSAITVSKAIETVSKIENDNEISEILDRQSCRMAKAPQSYFFNDIYQLHRQAIADNKTDFIDSATMMHHYHKKLYTIEGSTNNIKITTPVDYYIFKAIIEAQKGAEIFG